MCTIVSGLVEAVKKIKIAQLQPLAETMPPLRLRSGQVIDLSTRKDRPPAVYSRGHAKNIHEQKRLLRTSQRPCQASQGVFGHAGGTEILS